MSSVISISHADWVNSSTIVIEDNGVAYATVFKPNTIAQAPEYCVVCKNPLSYDAKDLYNCTSSTTQTRLSDLLVDVIMSKTKGSVKFTNTRICQRCFGLLDRADNLKHNVKLMKSELKSIAKDLSSNLSIVTEIPEEIKPNNYLESNPPQGEDDSYENMDFDNNYEDTNPDQDKKPIKEEYFEPKYNAEPSLTCQFCSNSSKFHTKEELANHFDSVHSSTSFVLCKLCNQKVYGGVKHFLLHMASKHPSVPIKQGLGILKVQTVKKKKVPRLDIFDIGHKKANRKPEKLRKISIRQPVSASKFPYPALIKNRAYQITCPYCQKSLSSQSIRKHIAYQHSSDTPFRCSQCPERFIKRYHLEKHQKDIHGIVLHQREKKLMCKVCGKLFFNDYTLRKHSEMVHENRRDYLCNICGMGYKTPSALKVHLRRHTGAHPYTCNICNKSFVAAGSIKKHVRTVHKIDINTRLNDPLNTNPYISVDTTKI